MRQGVWRLAGAFPIAHLNHSSRLFTSSCTSFLFATQPTERLHPNSKAGDKGKVGRPRNHNGLPLDHNGQLLFQYGGDDGLGGEDIDPSISPVEALRLRLNKRKAQKAEVLGTNEGDPQRQGRQLSTSPYIDPSWKESTASYRHSYDRKPRIDPYIAWKEETLNTARKQSRSWFEELPTLSPEQQEVVKLAESGANIFYTGSAGTGKSIVLQAIVKRLKSQGATVQVAAPTGKAAFNVNGITTWSYVGWSPGLTRQSIEDLVFKSRFNEAAKNRITRTDVLIIDEINMVENHHFERLNRVHKELRDDHSPFGGVQVIVVGDFCQLPPVLPFELCYECGSRMDKKDNETEGGTTYTCKPCKATFSDADKWAFRSKAWKECNFRTVHLTEIHRQRDPKFIDILQKCRVGARLTDQDIDLLANHASNTGNATKLFPTRWEARSVNDGEFYKLKGKPRVFKCIDRFQWERELHAELEYLGERNPDRTLKALREQVLEPKVQLKVGMPVVLFHNLDVAKGLVNGSQGVVIGFERVPFARAYADRILNTNIEDTSDPAVLSILEDEFLRRVQGQQCPVVEFPNGEVKVIKPITRVVEYGSKPPHTLLARVQLPLGPAWAMTIHRSQGLTMDRVVVDLSKAFAMGQSYVALSRAKSLKGLKVEGDPEKLRTGMGLDQAVKDFMDKTFGDVWTSAGSVSETSSVPPPMQQAVDRNRASSG